MYFFLFKIFSKSEQALTRLGVPLCVPNCTNSAPVCTSTQTMHEHLAHHSQALGRWKHRRRSRCWIRALSESTIHRFLCPRWQGGRQDECWRQRLTSGFTRENVRLMELPTSWLVSIWGACVTISHSTQCGNNNLELTRILNNIRNFVSRTAANVR